MKKPYIISFILAIALVIVCVKLAIGVHINKASTGGAQDMVINNIMTRVSIRAYQDKPVPKADIERLLRAGMAAPTSMNKQPWHFIIITDKKQLNAIGAAMPNAKEAGSAPLAIAVCGDMAKAKAVDGRDEWAQDASAATENILLAAHAMGLGAVWTGTYPKPDRMATMTKILQLPQGVVPFNTILIGYPAESPTPKDKWKTSNISYNTYGDKAVADNKTNSKMDEFKDFDVKSEFANNAFTFFNGTGHGVLLAAGDRSESNAMTISWGGLGTLWGGGDNAATVTVYVAQSRYTLGFMQKAKYFTVMSFDKEHENVPNYMGSHSGRDGDKAKALGLHTLYTENGTPYYAEASMVIECEMMYSAPFNPTGFKDIPRKLYSHFPAGVHTQFIGRVVKAMRK